MISERISDDIPPQMKILNMVIPILMHFCSFISNWSVVSRINRTSSNETISDSISKDILSQISYVIQSDVALQKLVH